MLAGSFPDRSHCASRAPEATVAAVVVEVASIVGVAEEVVLAADRVAGIGVGVADAVGQVANTIPGSRVEELMVQSTTVGVREERRDSAVEEGRIVEVVANRVVVVDEVCLELVAGAGIESIVVDRQLREGLAEGRPVGHMVGVG